MKKSNISIGERVRAARESVGLSRQELHAKTGLAGLGMIETGRREGIGSLKKIARALGITLGQLVDWPVSKKQRVRGRANGN